MARTKGAVNQKTMIAFINKTLPEFKTEGMDKKAIKEKYLELKKATENAS